MKKVIIIAIIIILIVGIICFDKLKKEKDVENLKWDVYFDNLVVSEGSVLSNNSIDNKTSVTSTLSFYNPGDYYEFSVDVLNKGEADGMISSVETKVNDEEKLPDYLECTLSYADDNPIGAFHLVKKGSSDTYKVRLTYKGGAGELNDLKFDFIVNYGFATEDAVERHDYRFVYRNSLDKVENLAILGENPRTYNTINEIKKDQGLNVLLRHRIVGNQIVESSAGFVLNDNYYFLVVGIDHFDENKETLINAFGIDNCVQNEDSFQCKSEKIKGVIYNNGEVSSHDGREMCKVEITGLSYCAG